MNEKSDESYTLDISKDLRLSTINFPKFEKNVSTPDELNDYLRNQLDHMKNENATLQQQLLDKNLELQRMQTVVDELSEKIKDYEGCSNGEFVSASQLVSSKIVQLSKKLREKTSEIEVHKSKCSKLEHKLAELQKSSEAINDIEEKTENEPDELKKLQDKLTSTTNKWIEEKNQNLQLKNDLRRANKWLQQEVGEKFETLLTLNNSNSNWRGRAQIICDLQQKNMTLKEKLKTYQDKNISSAEIVPTRFDRRVETFSKENLEIKNNYDELKRKYEATRARCKALENEYGLLKSKFSSLNHCYETDQQTIARLRSQASGHDEQKNEELRQKEQIIKQLHRENELLKVDLTKEKCLSENKSKELLEKNDDIQLLNKRIRSSRPPSAYIHRPENPERQAFNRLEVERLRLLELAEIQNTRLQDERNAHLKTQHFLRIEKQKCAKLEANLARLQLEQSSFRSGYSSKIITPNHNETEIKDKLELAEESIKALTTRLEIEVYERKNDLQKFSGILKNCDL